MRYVHPILSPYFKESLYKIRLSLEEEVGHKKPGLLPIVCIRAGYSTEFHVMMLLRWSKVFFSCSQSLYRRLLKQGEQPTIRLLGCILDMSSRGGSSIKPARQTLWRPLCILFSYSLFQIPGMFCKGFTSLDIQCNWKVTSALKNCYNTLS